jgi:dehydrogenase/reductase SDR family protein 7B
MNKTLDKKVIWLTGASSGIGEALATSLSTHSCKLILSARNAAQLERVKRCCENGDNNVIILPMDLSKSDELLSKVQEAWSYFGKIDVVIHNAGIAVRDLAVNTCMEMDRRVMEINYFGPMLLTKYLLPFMLQRKNGHIVAISSLSGKYGVPRLSAYAASKHALHGYFDSLRTEVASQNIRVTTVVPGFIRTPLGDHAFDGKGEAYVGKITANEKGMEAEACARKIIQAITAEKNEALVGGSEMFSIYLNRFFPSLFSRIIRNHPLRRLRTAK